MGLRLQLRKQQAEAGDIVLLYGDESEALTRSRFQGASLAKTHPPRRQPTGETVRRLLENEGR